MTFVRDHPVSSLWVVVGLTASVLIDLLRNLA